MKNTGQNPRWQVWNVKNGNEAKLEIPATLSTRPKKAPEKEKTGVGMGKSRKYLKNKETGENMTPETLKMPFKRTRTPVVENSRLENDRMKFTLLGQLFSKANSRRQVVNRRTGKVMYIKSAPALECVMSMRAQARAQWQGLPLDGPVQFTAHIWYPSRRQDLDESLLMDLLQGICYHNDRQIERKVITRSIDFLRPRVEVEVEVWHVEHERQEVIDG